MRTIKFRGKCTDNGKWVYGSLVSLPSGTSYIKTFTVLEPWGLEEESFQIEPETIGISTGAIDSLGTEIYEGDILCSNRETANGNNPRVLVVFGLYSGFEVAKNNHTEGCEFILLLNKKGVAEYAVVIGNIHDNPELMEGGEK